MLTTGIAYHASRMRKHVEQDLADCARNNFNAVMLVFTDNDIRYGRKVMKEMIKIAEYTGLEPWVNCWGLQAPPGERSGFMGEFPDARQVYTNGKPVGDRACFNSPDLRHYIKVWLDRLREAEGKSVFWDEPYLLEQGFSDKDIAQGKAESWTCYCDRCRQLFQDKYGTPMPIKLTPEVLEFRDWSIIDYFTELGDYARGLDIKNVICIRPEYGIGISQDELSRYAAIKSMDNIGTDPYWTGRMTEPYNYVRKVAENCVAACEKHKKNHHLWIQGYGFTPGREEEMINAADAIYDGGARSVFTWSYRGGEGGDLSASRPELAWKTMGDAMARLKERYRNERLNKMRNEYTDQFS